MKVKIKLFDQTLPLPEYKTVGAAGFDLYVRETVVISPKEFALVPANLAIKVPKGYFMLVNSRGSTYSKFGLLVIPGILDEDFCGDEDECKIQVLNLSSKKVELEKGTRIAQGILVKITRAEFTKVQKMKNKNRGMLGTTGHK